MTDQTSEAGAPARARREAALNTGALLALCALFGLLDVLGMIYILVERPGQDLTVMVMIGGVAVLALFVVLFAYIVTNPIIPRPRSAAPRPTRTR